MHGQFSPPSPVSARAAKVSWRSGLLFLAGGILIGVAAAKFLSFGRQADLTKIPLPPRIERPCAVVLDKTAIIVVHGQSNAANYGNTRYTARHAVDNLDPSSGKCFAAADPLLGTDGFGGNFATRLGDMLIEAGRYDRVIVVPIAVQGASLSALDTTQAGKIDNAIAKLKAARLTPTHILFQQGEADATLTTTEAQYVALLHRIVTRFRAAGFAAPFYLSQSSKCEFVNPGNRAAVRAGQLAATSDQLDVRRGPDTDLIENDGRNPHDGCHMNELGTIANAALWAAYIK